MGIWKFKLVVTTKNKFSVLKTSSLCSAEMFPEHTDSQQSSLAQAP